MFAINSTTITLLSRHQKLSLQTIRLGCFFLLGGTHLQYPVYNVSIRKWDFLDSQVLLVHKVITCCVFVVVVVLVITCLTYHSLPQLSD